MFSVLGKSINLIDKPNLFAQFFFQLLNYIKNKQICKGYLAFLNNLTN